MERSNYWVRRMNRRRFVAGTAAGGVGLAGLALAGCGDDDDDDGESPTQAGGETPSDAAAKEAAKKNSTEKETLQVRHNAP